MASARIIFGDSLTVLDWSVGAPPPRPLTARERRSAELDAIAEECRKRPGDWALVGRWYGRNAGSASSLRNRGLLVRQRHVDGMTEVWACWPKGDGQ